MDACLLDRLELLVHLDLNRYRRHYTCFCTAKGRRHREYFAVTNECARENIKLSHNFLVNYLPYAADGSLKPIWHLHIERVLLRYEGAEDYASRRDMWQRITTNVTVID
ncbi:hypothetical protein DOTSEDRAFT_67146 [Dothistroma septosporum NZE10]|uniref:Bacteriophage T5 Orf172 DNA-binding domain-containing protein n=1 Tax=Dothistroma septosporum (strain NZE10 / CBS 128990) TaxID=675120 RepID=N1PBI5_DOTSN|nr:hypothetical protein DOTSEDRAFT_67146 [Dothistroma septosporum NZE10]